MFTKSFFICSSPIETFYIPSKLFELKNGWCCHTRKLNEISISSENKNFIFIDNEKKILAGKMEAKSDTFDNICFACRDIEKVYIQPNILRILPYSFSNCEKLSKIEFDENSRLNIIDSNAFNFCCLLEEITIPVHVRTIGDDAFSKCKKLQKVCFNENCELERIEKSGFAWTSVESIVIPKKVNSMGKTSFIGCQNLKTVEILCDDLSICNQCFYNCHNLSLASVPNASKLALSSGNISFIK